MACNLTAPRHYPNQCWLLISEALWHSSESSFTTRIQATILCQKFGNNTFKITATSPRDQWVDFTSLIDLLSKCPQTSVFRLIKQYWRLKISGSITCKHSLEWGWLEFNQYHWFGAFKLCSGEYLLVCQLGLYSLNSLKQSLYDHVPQKYSVV